MVDADICIELRRGRNTRIGERLAALKPGEALLSVIAYGELRVGVEKSRDREKAMRALDVLVTGFPIAAPPIAIACHYGLIRAELERRGESIGRNDLWIAAHARAEGLTLVTGNEREFRRVPDLRVENWASETA